jgi:hypothetical protein
LLKQIAASVSSLHPLPRRGRGKVRGAVRILRFTSWT